MFFEEQFRQSNKALPVIDFHSVLLSNTLIFVFAWEQFLLELPNWESQCSKQDNRGYDGVKIKGKGEQFFRRTKAVLVP